MGLGKGGSVRGRKRVPSNSRHRPRVPSDLFATDTDIAMLRQKSWVGQGERAYVRLVHNVHVNLNGLVRVRDDGKRSLS